VDPDTVLAVFDSRLVGKESGAVVEARRGAVCVFTEHRIVRCDIYESPEEARNAAGFTQSAKQGDTGPMSADEVIWISLRGAMLASRRSWDVRLAVRFPIAFQAIGSITLHLPRQSRVRQAVLRRAVIESMGAWSRGDFEAALTRYTTDALVTVEARSGFTLDFDPPYHGHDGVRTLMHTFQDAFRDHIYEPQWLVDLGENTLVFLLQHNLRGRASGAEVEQVSAHRIELRDGLVAREQIHAAPGGDWDTVMHAVGLGPSRFAGPTPWHS
jgi:ketosteroid isomerase-like protein